MNDDASLISEGQASLALLDYLFIRKYRAWPGAEKPEDKGGK